MLTLNDFCRQFRREHKITLAAIENSKKVAAISAFECGHSSSGIHFVKYLTYARNHGLTEEFIRGLLEVTTTAKGE